MTDEAVVQVFVKQDGKAMEQFFKVGYLNPRFNNFNIYALDILLLVFYSNQDTQLQYDNWEY